MYCGWCGRDSSEGDGSECDGSCRDGLEPMRYCPECARTLDVQITPLGYVATCRKHGLQNG